MANLNIKPAASGDDLILKDGAGNNIVEIDNTNGMVAKDQNGFGIMDVSTNGVRLKNTGGNVLQTVTGNGIHMKDNGGNDLLAVTNTGVVISNAAAPIATINANGLVMNDADLVAPRVKGYTEAVYANGNKSAAFDIDLSNGNIQTATITSGTFNIGIANALSMPDSSDSITLVLTDGGAGTVSFVAGAHGGGGNAVKWAGGTAPTLTASGVDILVFFTPDSGTTFYGFTGGLNFS